MKKKEENILAEEEILSIKEDFLKGGCYFEVTHSYSLDSRGSPCGVSSFPSFSITASAGEFEVGEVEGYFFKSEDYNYADLDAISGDTEALAPAIEALNDFYFPNEYHNPFGEFNFVIIDRLTVNKMLRGIGIGSDIMKKTLIHFERNLENCLFVVQPAPFEEGTKKKYEKKIKAFYVKLGFKKIPLRGLGDFYYYDPFPNGKFDKKNYVPKEHKSSYFF